MIYKSILFILMSLAVNAQKNGISSHQEQWEFYKENPGMAGKDIAPPLLAKRSDLMQTQTMNKVVYGFHPYWQNGSESNYYFSLLTHLAYFSADINPSTGEFSSTHSWSSANVVTLAKQYGVKVHLCLVLFQNHSSLLSSTTAKNALIQNTLTQLALRNADGVNIDFESMSSGVKTDFRNFMKQFGDSLKAHGYEFVIELPAVDWSNIFDATFFSTLNSVTDFYFCMLYDYWWSGSATAGPNSPLRASNVTSMWHVLRSIDTYINTKSCPPGKFIAGFPSYGRDWRVKSTAPLADTLGSSPSASRTYTVVKNNYIDTIPAERQYWSTTYNTRYYNYVSGGNWRQVWYDDSLSWAKKFDSIKVKNVAGTGMWALGYDGSEPELWGALKTAFAQSPDPSHTSFDNFESGSGRFTTSPTFSGSTVGISTASSSAVTNDVANNGAQSLQVVLKDNSSSSSDWTVRHLSGSGSRSNNVQFTNSGYLGFWMKTGSAPAGAQVAVTIDDQRSGSSDRTELSSKKNVISDGAWHLYEWQLPGSGWTSFASGNGVLDSSILSLDAIIFYAPDNSPDWTLFIDDVSHNTSSPLPVELSDFSIFNKQLSVHLEWTTISESDNYGFSIERKFSANFGANPTGQESESKDEYWQKVGFIEDSGNNYMQNTFSFVDAVTRSGNYTYRLRRIDRSGAYHYSREINVSILEYPEQFSLEQNFPNPFNPSTTIQFSVPDGAENRHISLKIYDLLGREAAVLVDEPKKSGIYSVNWNASGLSSGIYLSVLKSGAFEMVKKLQLVK